MEEEFEWEKLEPIPLSYGVLGISFGFVFFFIVNQIVTSLGEPSSLRSLPWKWRNFLVSWIHACLISIIDITCFVRYPEALQDPIAFFNGPIYAMVCFSVGYFLYDFMFILVSRRVKQQWEVMVHHVIVLGIFTYNIAACRYLAYSGVALLVEINSVFLHARKLMQMCQVTHEHLAYRVNVWLNIGTFLGARFPSLLAILWAIVHWRQRMSPFYRVLLGASMAGMALINLGLFWRLLLSDVLKPRRTAAKAANGVATNNNSAAVNDRERPSKRD